METLEVPNVPGISGLVNIGNTCYMNSLIQCLIATDIFLVYFIGKNKKEAKYIIDLKYNCFKKLKENKKEDEITEKDLENEMKKRFSYNLAKLFNVMYGESCIVRPIDFKQAMEKHLIFCQGNENRNAQHDSHEFLNALLDKIHEDTSSSVKLRFSLSPEQTEYLNKYEKFIYNFNMDCKKMTEDEKKEYVEYLIYRKKKIETDVNINYMLYREHELSKMKHSIITDIFNNYLLEEIKCDECNHKNFVFSSHTALTLDIVSHETKFTTLYECLDDAFDKANMRVTDKSATCDICEQKCNKIIKTKIWKSSPRLIIQLKRFSGEYNKITQMYRKSKITSTIDFPLENLNMAKYTSDKSESCIYDLYGVVYHCGGLESGHYISFTKNAVNGKWYLYDDDDVFELSTETIKKRWENSGPYMLFYKKRMN